MKGEGKMDVPTWTKDPFTVGKYWYDVPGCIFAARFYDGEWHVAGKLRWTYPDPDSDPDAPPAALTDAVARIVNITDGHTDTCARCAELNAEIERLRAALARETATANNLQGSLVKLNAVRIETELRAERAEAALADCRKQLEDMRPDRTQPLNREGDKS